MFAVRSPLVLCQCQWRAAQPIYQWRALLLANPAPSGHAPALARHFSLVVPDLPGYGWSDAPASDAEHAPYTKRANGGRVLDVCALGKTVAEAQARAYRAVDRIRWADGFCRRDIGFRAVEREKASS